jgi:hypothetical protein
MKKRSAKKRKLARVMPGRLDKPAQVFNDLIQVVERCHQRGGEWAVSHIKNLLRYSVYMGLLNGRTA